MYLCKILKKTASRPGRKAKNKPINTEETNNAGNSEETNNFGEIQEGNTINKDLQMINFNQDILNSLVSPLRKDLIFGKIFKKLYIFLKKSISL